VVLSLPVAAASVANNPLGVVATVVVNPPAVVIISDPFPAAVPVPSGVCMLSFSLFTVEKKRFQVSKNKVSISIINAQHSASRS